MPYSDSDIPPVLSDTPGRVFDAQGNVTYTETPEIVARKNADIMRQYTEQMALKERANQDEIYRLMATLPVQNQMAVQVMLENRHRADIEFEQHKIKQQEDAQKLKAGLELSAARLKAINEAGPRQAAQAAITLDLTRARLGDITVTGPRKAEQSAVNLDLAKARLLNTTQEPSWVEKQRYGVTEAELELLNKAAASDEAQSLPPPEQAKLKTAIDKKKQELKTMEANFHGNRAGVVETNAPASGSVIEMIKDPKTGLYRRKR